MQPNYYYNIKVFVGVEISASEMLGRTGLGKNPIVEWCQGCYKEINQWYEQK